MASRTFLTKDSSEVNPRLSIVSKGPTNGVVVIKKEPDLIPAIDISATSSTD